MIEVSLSNLKKENTSEELAQILAEEINIITLKRAVQIAGVLKEERVNKMNKIVRGLESL